MKFTHIKSDQNIIDCASKKSFDNWLCQKKRKLLNKQLLFVSRRRYEMRFVVFTFTARRLKKVVKHVFQLTSSIQGALVGVMVSKLGKQTYTSEFAALSTKLLSSIMKFLTIKLNKTG